MNEISIKNAPKPIGPYSQAILANGMLFISGQIPVDPFTGELVQGDIISQTKQVMLNLKNILTEANMDFSNVAKVSIFLKDLTTFKEVNEIYASFLGDHRPARETIEVSGLPMNAGIEISLIAL